MRGDRLLLLWNPTMVHSSKLSDLEPQKTGSNQKGISISLSYIENQVVGVAVGCTLCFATRSPLIVWSAYNSLKHPTLEFNLNWRVALCFYSLLEIVPILLMLFLLRKLPEWNAQKNQTRYV